MSLIDDVQHEIPVTLTIVIDGGVDDRQEAYIRASEIEHCLQQHLQTLGSGWRIAASQPTIGAMDDEELMD